MFLLLTIFLGRDLLAQTILVDPGHGGEDLGAQTKVLVISKKGQKMYKTFFEKDLTLSISKEIKKHLKKDYKVFLTRSVDRTVSLEKRAELAEKIKADLFISVHINSSTQKSSEGFETYYLDNHNDLAVRKVEAAENFTLAGVDETVHKILIDLVVERTVKRSTKLAKLIHQGIERNIENPFKMKNRGIKPGLFYVLALSKRPGVLLEVGFISNNSEVWKIRKKAFRLAYAKALKIAIDKYFGKTQIVPLF